MFNKKFNQDINSKRIKETNKKIDALMKYLQLEFVKEDIESRKTTMGGIWGNFLDNALFGSFTYNDEVDENKDNCVETIIKVKPIKKETKKKK